MAGYNPNYFNRNLIESMKQTIIKSIVNEGKKPPQDPMPSAKNPINNPAEQNVRKMEPPLGFDEAGDFFRKGYSEAKGQKRGDVANETEAQYAERMYTTQKRKLEGEARHYGKSAQGQTAREALAKLEKSYQGYKTPKPAAPAAPAAPGPKFVPGKPMPWQTQQTQEPTTSPQPPAGSKVVISTSKDREGKDVTNVGVTPPESERQRQMADPKLQTAIPEPSKWGSGQYMPTGKELEPQDIRPPAKPEEQVPEPRQASGAKPEKMPETDAEFVGPPDWMSQIPSPGPKGAEKAAQRQPGAGMGAPRTSPSFSETLRGMFQ